MNALVVDDHREVAEFIADALSEMEGFMVDIATSAEAADALVKTKHYDFMIVDVYLKGGDWAPDGLEFAKRVLAKDPEARVVLMTGKSYSKIITRVMPKVGNLKLLAKPIELTTLIDTVHQVMPEGDEDDS